MNPALFDAHNHLQDSRLRPQLCTIVEAARTENIRKMVVNGSTEQDWPEVFALAREYPEVLPSYGLHPWYIKDRSRQWKENLISYLGLCRAGVGEIGLDRWIEG